METQLNQILCKKLFKKSKSLSSTRKYIVTVYLGFGHWQMGNQSQDEVFLAAQEAVGAHRDSQGKIFVLFLMVPTPF